LQGMYTRESRGRNALCFEMWGSVRGEELVEVMEWMDGWQYGEEGSNFAIILEQACIDHRVGRELEKLWKSRFDNRPASSHSTRS